jgi:hypothetical protein
MCEKCHLKGGGKIGMGFGQRYELSTGELVDEPSTYEIIYDSKYKNPNLCFVCKKDEKDFKLFQCSVCKSVKYCSQECQKLDWKSHKIICSFLKNC